MRAVVARIPHEVKDQLRYDEVPWSRFGHFHGAADDVPGLLADVRSGDVGTADRALGVLWNRMFHQGSVYSAVALAVPFLVRIAADLPAYRRVEVLQLVAKAGRRPHDGDSSRTGLLQTAYQAGEWYFDPWAYPQNWSVEAVQDAIAADAQLLLPLLDDPGSEVRRTACHVLAASPGQVRRISAALHGRLGAEDVPEVRVSLVLAIAELARGHREERLAVEWVRAMWSDPAQAAELRLGAAIAWLCLVDGPVPGELSAVFDDTVTEEMSAVMERVPWIMTRIPWMQETPDDAPGLGFSRCLAQLLGTYTPQPPQDDFW
ncbi:HEAT repeat domain-containing protein [Actinomadura craniellae]|uniref:HEAT repeat domain-containing protein n=1 Tax=Actinomadura craniellae TaxID=2231787 RepID=UPI0018F170CB|nr:HEAT repeat domain-containing protein [Actinomadura craniellae]